VSLVWIRSHDGSRWNEYVDSLANSFLRERAKA
jgi:ribonuclease HI